MTTAETFDTEATNAGHVEIEGGRAIVNYLSGFSGQKDPFAAHVSRQIDHIYKDIETVDSSKALMAETMKLSRFLSIYVFNKNATISNQEKRSRLGDFRASIDGHLPDENRDLYQRRFDNLFKRIELTPSFLAENRQGFRAPAMNKEISISDKNFNAVYRRLDGMNADTELIEATKKFQEFMCHTLQKDGVTISQKYRHIRDFQTNYKAKLIKMGVEWDDALHGLYENILDDAKTQLQAAMEAKAKQAPTNPLTSSAPRMTQ